jgi:hypothetical protein
LGQHNPEKWIDGMLTISEAQRRTELFLTGQMLEALHAVEYELPSFDTQLHDVDLAAVARARVEIRHVRGASDATYLINAFGEELLMQLQLNVHRLVVVYRLLALDALDFSTLAVRLKRWRIGARMPDGNSAGANRPLPAIRAAVCRNIAMPLPETIFSKTSRSNSIGAPTLCTAAFASRPAAPDSRCKPVLMSRVQEAVTMLSRFS